MEYNLYHTLDVNAQLIVQISLMSSQIPESLGFVLQKNCDSFISHQMHLHILVAEGVGSILLHFNSVC